MYPGDGMEEKRQSNQPPGVASPVLQLAHQGLLPKPSTALPPPLWAIQVTGSFQTSQKVQKGTWMVGDEDCPLSKVICCMGDVLLCLLSLVGADWTNTCC